MNILLTSLLTISLLVVAPGCRQNDKCSVKSVDSASHVEQEELAYAIQDELATSQNIKC